VPLFRIVGVRFGNEGKMRGEGMFFEDSHDALGAFGNGRESPPFRPGSGRENDERLRIPRRFRPRREYGACLGRFEKELGRGF
jgi:hypothetical protein